jgi:hypothetical protein
MEVDWHCVLTSRSGIAEISEMENAKGEMSSPGARHKKIPKRLYSPLRIAPCFLILTGEFSGPLSTERNPELVIQAGLLTPGSSYSSAFPSAYGGQWPWNFVPGYSGGTAPDSHGIPFA